MLWGELRLFVCALGVAVLAACAGPPRHDPFVDIASLSEGYGGPPLPDALPECEDLLDPERGPRWRRIADQAGENRQNWRAREVHAHILSFDENYADGRIHAALTEPLDFMTDIADDDEDQERLIFVRVPAGFITDFSSIPSGLPQSFHRTFGRTAIPAIVHDFLYAVGEPNDREGRKIADRVLRRGMRDNESGFFSRRIVHIAVRTRGAAAYGRPSELRFFDPNRAEGARVVRPTGDRQALFANYVKVCARPRHAP